MIYIKFCIRKSILKLFGVSFLGGKVPKILTFSGSAPERLERGPQYSARRRNFEKRQRTFVVLRLGYNPSQRNDASFQNPRCPTQKNKKKCRFCPFWHCFQPNGWGTVGIGMRRNFFSWDCSPIAELQTYVGVFENSSDGPSTVALFLGVRGRTR